MRSDNDLEGCGGRSGGGGVCDSGTANVADGLPLLDRQCVCAIRGCVYCDDVDGMEERRARGDRDWRTRCTAVVRNQALCAPDIDRLRRLGRCEIV